MLGYADVKGARKNRVYLNPVSDIFNKVTWSDIRYVETEKNVRKVQHRIYKAYLRENLKQLDWLQNFLISNLGSKLLSVRYASNLYGKEYPDNRNARFFSLTEVELASQLMIEKRSFCKQDASILKGQNLREKDKSSLLIESSYILLRLSIDPELEACFRLTSRMFHPSSTHVDAVKLILQNTRSSPFYYVYKISINKCVKQAQNKEFSRRFIGKSNVKNCLLNYLKVVSAQPLHNKLSSKHFLHIEVLSFVSKILSMDLQKHIFKIALGAKNNASAVDLNSSGVGVFCNNELLILHSSKKKLELYAEETKKWFFEFGIEVTPNDFEIRDSFTGFDFLGFQITQRQIRNKTQLKIYPSRVSQAQFLGKIRCVIQDNKSISSYDLIKLIKPVILHWGNYFRYFNYKPVFQKLSYLIFQKIRAWVFRRDTKNSRHYVKEKYFPSQRTYIFYGTKHESSWVLVGRKKNSHNRSQEIYLPHLSWITTETKIK
jgi:RNA-directed DNA polymerase